MSQIKRVVSCFCLTDGRSWYKQVVSGIYIFAAIAVISPFVFFGLAIIYGIFSTYPVLLIMIKVAIYVGYFLAALAVVVLLMVIYGWSIDN